MLHKTTRKAKFCILHHSPDTQQCTTEITFREMLQASIQDRYFYVQLTSLMTTADITTIRE